MDALNLGTQDIIAFLLLLAAFYFLLRHLGSSFRIGKKKKNGKNGSCEDGCGCS